MGESQKAQEESHEEGRCPFVLAPRRFSSGRLRDKPGWIGGQIVKAPGMTPVCSPSKENFLAGLRSAYRNLGQTLPPVLWSEVYSTTQDNTGFVRNHSDNMWNARYRVDDFTMNAPYGYHSTAFRHKTTGRWVLYLSFTEPRNAIMWQKKYHMYVGF